MKTGVKIAFFTSLVLLVLSGSAFAQAIPKISLEVGQASEPSDLSTTLQIVIMLTVLTLAPSIILMMTSFIRMVVVFGFLRQAIGTQQLPPNQLLMSLA